MSLIKLPLLNHADVALVQSLLSSHGFVTHIEPGFGESPDAVFINAADLEQVKLLLRDVLVHNIRGATGPIPW